MNPIEQKFVQLRAEKKKALIAFLTAGYPDLKTTARYLSALEKAGVDIVELGIPFSDPLADGPTIQFSSQKALEKGVTLGKIFSWLKEIRRDFTLPTIFMSYYNPLYRFGGNSLLSNMQQAGVDGLIVPDLPPDEEKDFQGSLKKKIRI